MRALDGFVGVALAVVLDPCEDVGAGCHAVGLVHEGNFRDYFLPTFASMWQRRIPQQSSPTGMLGRVKMSTRFFALDLRPPLVGTTALGHDACARRSAVVVAPEAPARCASNLLLLRRAAKVFS